MRRHLVKYILPGPKQSQICSHVYVQARRRVTSVDFNVHVYRAHVHRYEIITCIVDITWRQGPKETLTRQCRRRKHAWTNGYQATVTTHIADKSW